MVTRRAWLKGAAGGAAGLALLRDALAAGKIEKGVYRIKGEAQINGTPARIGREVKAGDVIVTGKAAELVFVIDRDAMMVRAGARVEIEGKAGALIETGLRIVTGAVLSVFEPGKRKRIDTATATIGIRGTGIYVEALPGETYVCTCYGVADIAAVDDPSAHETVRTEHHDQPRFVMAHGAPQMIMKAPVVNHTDAELILLESLVGRRPAFYGKQYGGY
ncbi:MAG TPA: hypothetical protein VLX30_11040 [Burkholderiales bacterium]|nr:hypothetical protein [Burkholderiales bacterium]